LTARRVLRTIIADADYDASVYFNPLIVTLKPQSNGPS